MKDMLPDRVAKRRTVSSVERVSGGSLPCRLTDSGGGERGGEIEGSHKAAVIDDEE